MIDVMHVIASDQGRGIVEPQLRAEGQKREEEGGAKEIKKRAKENIVKMKDDEALSGRNGIPKGCTKFRRKA
jgi:predicted transcriptional regulator